MPHVVLHLSRYGNRSVGDGRWLIGDAYEYRLQMSPRAHRARRDARHLRE